MGNVDTITDSHGKVVERLSYDPFGKRRQLDGTPLRTKYKVKLTNRGYTGHEHLDDIGLIHMNARLYDVETARFISADTYIQAPANSQSHNRYIYVVNNPLKYNDPSGHYWQIVATIFAIVVAVSADDPRIQIVAIIAAAYFTAGASLVITGAGATTVGGAMSAGLYGQGLVAAFAGGFVAGGITTGTVEGALMGGFTAAVTAGVGHGNAGNSIFGGKVATALGHGVTKGAISEIRGGEFKDGFVGGVVGHVSGYAMGEVGGNGGGAVFGRTAIAAAAGGLTAEATGGSFEDGAFQAAMTHLFNEEVSGKLNQQLKRAPTSETNPNTEAMVNDPTVSAEINKAWAASNPYTPGSKQEHGFWILQNPNTQAFSVQQFPSSGTQDSLIPGPVPNDSVSFFHTHPNTASEGYISGPSPADINFSNSIGLPGIIQSHDGIYYFGQ